MIRSTSCLSRLISNKSSYFYYPYSKTVEDCEEYKKKVARIIQYRKETKALFGSLQKLKSQKRKQKSDKNSPSTKADASERDCGAPSRGNATASCLRTDYGMWSKALAGHVGLRVVNACGLKTLARNDAAQSTSTMQTGLVSEDKILQIKPHRNDYSSEYPSVTLILNKTMPEESKAALEKWKKEKIEEMGEEEFRRYYEASMEIGSKFHDTLKRYFTEPQHKLAIETGVEPVWRSVSHLLGSISAPRAIESNVVHPVLKYRGIFDAIANFEDKPMLIEWKKSDKPRRAISMTYDNPIQLAAYFGAVNNDLNYKHFNVRDALLVIAYTDGSKADHFHLTIDKLREYWAHWLVRLENYSKNHASGSEKILKGGKRLFEEDIGNLQ